MTPPIRFDDAFQAYLRLVGEGQATELAGVGQVIVLRDMRGRLRLVLEKAPASAEALAGLQARLDLAAGRFSAGPALLGPDLAVAEALFESQDLQDVPGVPGIKLLERVVTGADWLRGPLPNREPQPPRATLFGVKGGVGRSTALCAWARYLAKRGKKVLVVDLDLESPGVSSTLLPIEQTADFGVVDWLVEDAVGNADETLVRLMAAPSPLSQGMTGSVWVVPCGGSEGRDAYMAKLARAYLDVSQPAGGVQTFADRLARMTDALEAEHQPDVVLLDSRAGLHDIAAVTITRLGAQAFLFAVGTRQTWEAYQTLLSQWRDTTIGAEVRERLKLVAAQIPEEGREAYLKRFEEEAHRLLTATLYDAAEPPPDEDASSKTPPNAFSFALADHVAPHYRLPIYWNRVFQDWDPLSNRVNEDQINAAFGEFLRGASERLLGSEAVATPQTAPERSPA